MEGRLARITQGMLLVAARERHADEPVDRRADLANASSSSSMICGVGVERLKQITVKPAEIAVDDFPLLNLFDAVDRGGLAFIEARAIFPRRAA